MIVKEIDNLPAFIKPKDLIKLGILPISEPTLYQILNRQGCPKIKIGEKSFLINTAKFLQWLDGDDGCN